MTSTRSKLDLYRDNHWQFEVIIPGSVSEMKGHVQGNRWSQKGTNHKLESFMDILQLGKEEKQRREDLGVSVPV